MHTELANISQSGQLAIFWFAIVYGNLMFYDKISATTKRFFVHHFKKALLIYFITMSCKDRFNTYFRMKVAK